MDRAGTPPWNPRASARRSACWRASATSRNYSSLPARPLRRGWTQIREDHPPDRRVVVALVLRRHRRAARRVVVDRDQHELPRTVLQPPVHRAVPLAQPPPAPRTPPPAPGSLPAATLRPTASRSQVRMASHRAASVEGSQSMVDIGLFGMNPASYHIRYNPVVYPPLTAVNTEAVATQPPHIFSRRLADLSSPAAAASIARIGSCETKGRMRAVSQIPLSFSAISRSTAADPPSASASRKPLCADQRRSARRPAARVRRSKASGVVVGFLLPANLRRGVAVRFPRAGHPCLSSGTWQPDASD